MKLQSVLATVILHHQGKHHDKENEFQRLTANHAALCFIYPRCPREDQLLMMIVIIISPDCNWTLYWISTIETGRETCIWHHNITGGTVIPIFHHFSHFLLKNWLNSRHKSYHGDHMILHKYRQHITYSDYSEALASLVLLSTFPDLDTFDGLKYVRR